MSKEIQDPNDFPATVKILSKDELQTYSTLSPWQRLVPFIAIYGPILLAPGLVMYFDFYLATPLVWLIIASRQHGMAAMAHESVHGVLFKDKFFNDFFGRYFFAFPILVSLSRYRAVHLLHHRKLFESQDPDTPIYMRYPVSKNRFKKYLFRDITGRTFFKNFLYFVPVPKSLYPEGKDPIKHYPYESDGIQLLLFHVGLLIFFAWNRMLFQYVLFWWVPYFTILQVLLRIRGALEHGNVPDSTDPYQNTRTVTGNPVVLFFLAPLGLNYHLEHHLYPTIPWCSLKEVHKKIVERIFSAKISRGYTKAVRELIKEK